MRNIDFSKNVKIINKYYNKLIKKVNKKENIDSVNAWIIDNFYLISEQDKHIAHDIRNAWFIRLKKEEKLRITNFINSILEQKDSSIVFNTLCSEIKKFQMKNEYYFSYTELDYLYIYVKYKLIENLAELCKKLDYRGNVKTEINEMFAKVHNALVRKDFDIRKYVKINTSILEHPYYIEQMSYKLKELGDAKEDLVEELNNLLKNNNLSMKKIIESQQTDFTMNNLLISNIFKSIKDVVRIQEMEIYEKASFTEGILKAENLCIYKNMTDKTKKEYRSKIIKLSRKKGLLRKNKKSEYEIANDIVNSSNKENIHIGFYLFKNINYKLRTFLYLFSIFFITFVICFICALDFGIGAFIMLLIPINHLVIQVINQLLFHTTKIKSIFQMELKKGVPKEDSAMVVIPTILSDKQKVEKLFEKLEIYYLANKSDNIYYTLLGDCSSSATKDTDIDEEIVEMAKYKLEMLNNKYGDKFYFAYRNRFYNETEGSYLGFERKRGALLHFNALILGKLSKEEEDSYFRYHTFEEKPYIKYVITLDTDTKLVLNSAIRLVGAMSHPLNTPVLNKEKNKVISGYAIMQPKVAIDVEVTNKSPYTQLFAGLGGLDLYATSEFNLYQDVFGVGSFQGKGIYNLEIFSSLLSKRFPNNLILSHDLLEGSYLRCAFIDDIEIYDDYPSQYLNDAKRQHRWTRGDWQIMSWLKKRVTNQKEDIIANPLNTLDKWKIFDNLRRSIVPFFTLLLLFYSFTFGRSHSIFYMLIILAIIVLPILFHLFCKIIYRRQYSRFLRYYLQLLKDTFACIYKSLVVICILPYEAFMFLDAVVKALYRMKISHKNLLNWIEFAEVEKQKNTFKTYIFAFKANYICGVVLLLLAMIFYTDHSYIAVTFVYLWLMGPLIMYLLSKEIKTDGKKLNERELNEINELGFKTWKYFETYLTAQNYYLIPDNYTLDRESKLDDRTSPTNIGFSIISVICARKLKYISSKAALDYLNNIIYTVEGLNKWNGHLYNWYDIKTKKELIPYMVSTVDSGNLIASLYVAKSFVAASDDWQLLSRIEQIIDKCDFTKVYNKDLKVFSVGFDVTNQYLIPYHYNTFASESRLTSFIAISKEDVSYQHWFSLDKSLAKYKIHKGLVSWTGSMFEYFMPLLFMRTFKHTLLDESLQFSSFVQQDYINSKNKKLPWGISECAYNDMDDSLNYRYASFGVPQLRFRGKDEDILVISPYSSLIAFYRNETAVYSNIKKFKKLNMYGEYGFYDSYDVTDKKAIGVYYAHHQGMILAGITNYLKNDYIQDLFHENKIFEANEMLLKEKPQLKPYIDQRIVKYKKQTYESKLIENDIREVLEYGPSKECGILSNGRYSLLIDNNGLGFSKYKNMYINRFSTITNSKYGMFLYIKNLKSNKIWSNTYEPTKAKPDRYCTVFSSDKIKYIREDKDIITTTEIIVFKDFQGEIRKVTIVNNSNVEVELELTSFMESVLSKFSDELAHPAFNGLKLNSSFDEEIEAIVLKRASTSKPGVNYFATHKMYIENFAGKVEYETSKYNFLGRNNSLREANAIVKNTKFSAHNGHALDTIMSIRKKIKIKPNKQQDIYLINGFAKSMESIKEIINKYSNVEKIKQEFELSTIYNNLQISYSNLTGYQLKLYSKLIRYLFQPRTLSEQRKSLLSENELNVKTLWEYGITGNRPIVATIINNIDNLGFIKEIMQFFEFCQSKAIYIDVVIINNCEEKKLVTAYIDKYLFRLKNLNKYEAEGTIYNISADDLTIEQRALIHIASTIFIDTDVNLSIEDQLQYIDQNAGIKKIKLIRVEPKNMVVKDLRYYNNYGGFSEEGKEYVINGLTPTPWFNVIANENFGTLVSNDMSGFTYADNSREYKLTSWSNDIVSSYISECLIIGGKIFVPSITRHGFGYTKYLGQERNLDIEITTFVAKNDRVKFFLINITNTLNKKNTINNLAFRIRPVLGDFEENTSKFILSEYIEEDNYLELKNTYNRHFSQYVNYISGSRKIECFSDYIVDKEIGFNLEFDAKESKTIAINIGVCTKEEVKDSVSKYKEINKIESELAKVKENWQNILGTITVKTEDESFDYMINNWYLYQTYSSRLFARAGFYQVGGAFGFRDQLQDSMSLVYSNPSLTRAQILKHAAHQFREGDVLHWWQEESKFGSRTKFSDDYLWLIYVTYEYLRITADTSILEEEVGFVDGPKLSSHEDEMGIEYTELEEKASLYEHMRIAILKALNQLGAHNLPLMGSGDWNDGMNKVGHKGKGESVWMAFFLYDLLIKMANISEEMDKAFAEELLNKAEELKNNIYEHAWDGSWYLRAFFDNGEKLGSKENTQCRIDIISQAFSILTGIAKDDQKKSIINTVDQLLVDKENKIIKLFDPPFENPENDPGYIATYPKGVRENGGQYTHGAMWYILALLKEKENDKAYEYYQMINPINRTLTKNNADIYKIEPYVIAADIYANPDYEGRGGWSWYTGSASWAYKVGVESILGFKKCADKLYIDPNIPTSWQEYSIEYKYGSSIYRIRVIKSKKPAILINGQKVNTNYIPLVDNKKEYDVIINLGGLS